jgi:hypothetical membrane protein
MLNNFNIEFLEIKKFSGLCGILIPFVIFTCIGIALFYSPWFDWTKNALSDLGIEGISANFFNGGMIIGGILTFIFSIGLINKFENKTGPYILSLSSIALVGLGIFPETLFTIHWIFSATFFILLTISFLVLGLNLFNQKSERAMGLLATIFAIASLGSILLLIPWEGVAIPESISCFPAFIWFMIYGIKMATS